MKIIFAPHLDDEIIGCYSIINEVDKVIYFTKDYREENIKNFPGFLKKIYCYKNDFDFSSLTENDTLYLPSKHDFHPFHKIVRNQSLQYPCKKMFYSVEMNVPWLDEEKIPKGKLILLKDMYPNEDLFLKNDKYWLFNSIKPYDDIVWKVQNFSTPDFIIEGDYEVIEQIPALLYIQKFLDDSDNDIIMTDSKWDEIYRKVLEKSGNFELNFYYYLQTLFPNRLIKLQIGGLLNGKLIS